MTQQEKYMQREVTAAGSGCRVTNTNSVMDLKRKLGPNAKDVIQRFVNFGVE